MHLMNSSYTTVKAIVEISCFICS